MPAFLHNIRFMETVLCLLQKDRWTDKFKPATNTRNCRWKCFSKNRIMSSFVTSHCERGRCAIYYSLISNNRMKNLLTLTQKLLGTRNFLRQELIIASDPHLVGSIKACEKPTKYEICVEIKRWTVTRLVGLQTPSFPRFMWNHKYWR
jgi:hypothetical protein